MEQENPQNKAVDLTQVFRNLASSEAKYEFAKKIKANQTPITRKSAEEITDFLSNMSGKEDTEKLTECAYFCEKYSLNRDFIKLYTKNKRYDLLGRVYETQTDSDTAQQKAKEAYTIYLQIKTKEYMIQANNTIVTNQNSEDLKKTLKSIRELQELAKSKGLIKELTEQITPYLFPSSFYKKLTYNNIRANPEIIKCWQSFFNQTKMETEEKRLIEMKEKLENQIQERENKRQEKRLNREARIAYLDYFFFTAGASLTNRETSFVAQKAINCAEKAKNPKLVKRIKKSINARINHMESYETRASLKYQYGFVEEAIQEYRDEIIRKEKNGRFEDALQIARRGQIKEKIDSLETIVKAISSNRKP